MSEGNGLPRGWARLCLEIERVYTIWRKKLQSGSSKSLIFRGNYNYQFSRYRCADHVFVYACLISRQSLRATRLEQFQAIADKLTGQ